MIISELTDSRLVGIIRAAQARLDHDDTAPLETERRLMEACLAEGIPYDFREAAAISGAGPARHERRVAGLTVASIATIIGSCWGERASAREVALAATAHLQAYRLGGGGGMVDPGEGTDRALCPEEMGDLGAEIDAAGVARGGGFGRRYACGGEAWTAAASEAAARIESAMGLPVREACWSYAQWRDVLGELSTHGIYCPPRDDWRDAIDVARRRRIVALLAEVRVAPGLAPRDGGMAMRGGGFPGRADRARILTWTPPPSGAAAPLPPQGSDHA